MVWSCHSIGLAMLWPRLASERKRWLTRFDYAEIRAKGAIFSDKTQHVSALEECKNIMKDLKKVMMI